MKAKTLTVLNQAKDETIYEMSCFSYELVKEKQKGKYTKLYFERYVDVNEEILVLEERYFACIIPSMTPLTILAIITFICLTGLLVCLVSLKGTPYDKTLFITFGVASIISFIALSIYFYIRMFRLNRNIRESKALKDEIKSLSKEEEAQDEKTEASTSIDE